MFAVVNRFYVSLVHGTDCDKHYHCVYFSDYIGPIIGGVVAFVVLIAVIFILCCVIKKQQARRNALIPTTVHPGAANVSAYHKDLYYILHLQLNLKMVKSSWVHLTFQQKHKNINLSLHSRMYLKPHSYGHICIPKYFFTHMYIYLGVQFLSYERNCS